MDERKLIVVGGPNGSGKSTFALHHSESTGIRYIGADQIAAKISPSDPHSARIEASREFLTDIRQSITRGESLVVESTLAGKSLRHLIDEARAQDYHVTVLFAFLDSADTCVDRVKQRVKLGGHDVPEPDIRRRFPRSVSNFWNVYRDLADFWLLVYNAGSTPSNVAFGDATETVVRIDELYALFQSILDSND